MITKLTGMLLTVALAVSAVSKVSAATFYFHTDHLGTPQVVTDQNQQVVWQGEYGPFGEVAESVNVVEQNLRFPGQYSDRETELNYNYFRDYDPSLGRYVRPDPIGIDRNVDNIPLPIVLLEKFEDVDQLIEGINHLYGYVVQNPIKNIDPQGLSGGIAGFTRHGLNQVINRGVSPGAICDAVNNPISTRDRSNGTRQYKGAGAVVVLNPAGFVVTVWGQ